jgi:hypothetical protein
MESPCILSFGRIGAAACLSASILWLGSAYADEVVDTEHIFGFTRVWKRKTFAARLDEVNHLRVR